MDRDEILKSVGFSADFIKALDDFEKSVPEVHFEPAFDDTDQVFDLVDTTGELVIKNTNEDFSERLIVRS
jgi:hypothetical protein